MTEILFNAKDLLVKIEKIIAHNNNGVLTFIDMKTAKNALAKAFYEVKNEKSEDFKTLEYLRNKLQDLELPRDELYFLLGKICDVCIDDYYSIYSINRQQGMDIIEDFVKKEKKNNDTI